MTEKSYTISWKQFISLLYHLSIIFIDLNIDFGEEVHIKGIWSGKNNKDWTYEHMKIETRVKELQYKLYDYISPVRRFNENL